MKRATLTLALLLLAACVSTTQPTPAPAPAATPPADPNRLTAATASAPTIAEPRIRVGLLSDQPRITFPRTAEGYWIVSDAGTSVIRRGFTVTAPLSDAAVRYAVQMAAISDEGSANELASRLRQETGQKVDVIFDPASGQRRVLAGDFSSSEEATPFRAQLTDRGYGRDLLVVRRPSDQPFQRRHALADDEGESYSIEGESFLIVPVSGETISIDGKPYRTAARLHINPRGLLNVINELNMEDYLQGVVPAEMGPRIFDEVEALKAQAVAARTYAYRNLGQFRSEGYDICPGPACQAYIGFSGEHALSTQAVRETAGMILTHQGQPIDALYTSTCGGETSDVSTMFPGRNDPYLKRARCVELEMQSVAGRAESNLLTEQQAHARMFAAMAGLPQEPRSWSARDVEASVQAALRLGGADRPGVAGPRSSRRGDVLRYLTAVFDLASKGRILTLPEDRQYFFPAQADEELELAAAFLIKYGIWPVQPVDRIDLTAAMPREELHALLASWLREHGAVLEANGKIHSLSGRSVTLKAEGKSTSFLLPENIPVLRRMGERYQAQELVPVMIGDRASIFQDFRKTPVGMIVQANYDGASFDRTSSFANWTRSYRADELVQSINRRNPIRELIGIRPLVIDPSQRIAELEVTAEGGRTFVLRGLPVRWSLNVPDNLFVYTVTKDPDGVDRYTFFGKGWGHGTGFCQVGSYGMAFRGWTYDEILKHYYTDVEIVPMSGVRR